MLGISTLLPACIPDRPWSPPSLECSAPLNLPHPSRPISRATSSGSLTYPAQLSSDFQIVSHLALNSAGPLLQCYLSLYILTPLWDESFLQSRHYFSHLFITPNLNNHWLLRTDWFKKFLILFQHPSLRSLTSIVITYGGTSPSHIHTHTYSSAKMEISGCALLPTSFSHWVNLIHFDLSYT